MVNLKNKFYIFMVKKLSRNVKKCVGIELLDCGVSGVEVVGFWSLIFVERYSFCGYLFLVKR